ncbi:MAG: hypothetical protein SNH94_00435 [Rikenellaceae bacterium]
MPKNLRNLTLFAPLILPVLLYAHEPLPEYGVESKSTQFFSERYHYNDLAHYLDNLDLYVTYQAETTGQFNQPDQLVFSIEGNSYRWNSYYLDGFRIDSRYSSGSTFYNPDLYQSSLTMDYIGSNIFFTQQRSGGSSISASYNVGGLGGISPGTASMIHLFHRTASDRAYKPITLRNKIAGAGTISSTIVVEKDDKKYYHNQYIDFGQRNIVSFDSTGIDGYYPESYASAQFSGDLSSTLGSLFDSTHYLANYAYRTNLNSEFYYSLAETARYHGYSASFYGSAVRGDMNYTSGITFAQHNTKHEDINYARNIIDQDGEAFEPYEADGNTFELSHSILLKKRLNDWLTLTFDGYNSMLYTAPTTTEFYNLVYMQAVTAESATPLYIYKWSANSYASGLLENTLRLSTERELSKSLYFRADAALTLDAILLGDSKSKVSPNIEAQAGLSYNPNGWFSTEVTLARRRVAYTIEDVQYLSSDHLNGEIYYAGSTGLSGDYASGAKSENYFSHTGGAYHTLADGVQQPAYWAFDFPINFTFGRHRITFLQSARKYVNNWITSYDKDASEYGYYVADSASGLDIFYLNSGVSPSFVVDHYPDDLMGNSLLTSSPFCFSSNIQYSYTSPKFHFSFAWQSYMQSGISTLGNGPLHNNLGVLSESTANPNTLINAGNPDSEYMAVGRLDQERAYVMRMFASYNVSEKLGFAFNFKFKDGQPFSFFDVSTQSDSSGNEQIAIYPSTTRGINTFDGNFGTREDAFFNVELRATYRLNVGSRLCEMQLGFYNLYDFGTELTEYTFDQDLTESSRYSMSLTIPRGLTFSVKYYL